jgi:hypothetical protein
VCFKAKKKRETIIICFRERERVHNELREREGNFYLGKRKRLGFIL